MPTPRARPQSVPDLQREDQVRGARGQGDRAGLRRTGNRSLRPLSGGELRRAVDDDKDQSYVLAVLDHAQLSRAMFPCGDTPKPQIRDGAARRGLSVADKPDSHDICFIPTGDTPLSSAPGSGSGPAPSSTPIRGEARRTRRRAWLYDRPAQRAGYRGAGRRWQTRYVTGIDPESGTVTVGSAEHLQVWTIEAGRAVWTSGQVPDGPVDCVVQVRAHGGLAPARATP